MIRVVRRAITLTAVDFMITEGVRTPERQRQLYAQGRTTPGRKVTWTLTSRHFVQRDGYGHAVDVAALVDGTVSWDNRHYADIARAMKAAAELEGVGLTCGIDWKARDDVHFELT